MVLAERFNEAELMRFLLLLVPFILLACTEPVPTSGKSRILIMGDSLFATHQISGQSIGHHLERRLGEQVTDRSVLGARVRYALPISGSLGVKIERQYRPGPWQWVVLNGGGNDLWLGCGCSGCDPKMTRMISRDGSRGDIPALVGKLRKSGARVLYVGYLRSPGRGSPIEHCRDDGDALEARLAAMAERDPGVTFLSLKDVVPHGDRSYHAIDMIHPSGKGAQAIAARIARVITASRKKP